MYIRAGSGIVLTQKRYPSTSQTDNSGIKFHRRFIRGDKKIMLFYGFIHTYGFYSRQYWSAVIYENYL